MLASYMEQIDNKIERGFNLGMAHLLGGVDAKLEAQREETRAQMQEIDGRFRAVEQEQALLRSTLLEVKVAAESQAARMRGCATSTAGSSGDHAVPHYPLSAAVSTAASGSTDPFERKPDKTMVIIKTAEPMQAEQVRAAIFPIAVDELLIPRDEIQVEGKGKGKSAGKVFTMRFHGDSRTAAARASKFLLAQRQEDGAWRKISGKGSRGEGVPIFVGEDKNAKQQKTELLTKWTVAALRAAHPELDIIARKHEGRILLEKAPLARITVATPSAHKIVWNCDLVRTKGIDTKAVLGKLAEKTGPSESEIPWG